jgi:hypothetical protein
MVSDASVEITESAAQFRIGGTEVGRYVLDDEFKPYLHPLRTAGGRVVSQAKPPDHIHHKGLMYALTATDVNWWEEVPVEGYVDTPGVQRIVSTEKTGNAEILQELLWTAADGTRATFRERRRISCAWHHDGFVRWSWTADFEVLRPVELRHSMWNQEHRGRMVNYHGLGIRFPPEFGVVPSDSAWIAGDHTGPAEIIGRTPPSVTVTFLVDGEIPAARVSARITQVGTHHGWFAMQAPGFGYLSVGPTVLPKHVTLSAGDAFHEEYLIDIADDAFSFLRPELT